MSTVIASGLGRGLTSNTVVDEGSFSDEMKEVPSEDVKEVEEPSVVDMQEILDGIEQRKAEAEETLVDTAVHASEKVTMDVLSMKSDADIGSLDLAEIAEEVESMNYLQLRATKKQLDGNLAMIEMYYGMYGQIEKMSQDVNSVAAKAFLSNQLQSQGIDQGADEFCAEYVSTKKNIQDVLDILNPKLEAFAEKAKSTKFLTEQMIGTIDQKIAEIETLEGDHEYTLNSYRNLREIYSHRTDLTYLKSNLQGLRKMKKMCYRENKKQMGRVKVDLEKFFQAASMAAFEQYLVKTWGEGEHAENAAIVCLTHLGKILTTHSYLNNMDWAKVFVMNALDIIAGIWDLDEMSAEDYTEQVKSLYDTYRIDNENFA